MDLFYIDRQFGQPIFIEVEKSIVQNCYNETEKFNNKMNEVYKDKEISFLKTDFEKRMKPSYHNVRPLSLTSIQQNINTIESHISNINKLLYPYELHKKENDNVILLKAERIKLTKELSEYQNKLKLEIKRIKTEHNYNC